MGWVRNTVLSLLFMLSLSFATIIESGDAGAEFVNATAAAKCQEANVQAVYECLGNVVRVVSSVPGEGSTFYKPEGKVIRCPVVEPTDMGAECLQMMTPNYCPVAAECGYAPVVPQVFPGQNDTPEQTGDADAYIVEGQAATGTVVEPEPVVPEPEPYVPRTRNVANESNEIEVPANTAASGVDGMFGYLFYVVLLLGLGAIGVLFMLFRNTLAEEEA